MTFLWVSLLAVSLFAFSARYFSVDNFNSSINITPNKILTAAAALTLILISGLRRNIGDTYFYRHGYQVSNYEWGTILEQSDLGFSILQMLLKQISNDPQILLITTALITNAIIVLVIYQYSRMLELSLYIYITSGAFIVSMNGLRQYLAAAIVFAATKALFDGRWKLYMFIVLIATFIHQSALIMIPVYFIVRRKAWTGTTYLLLSVAILIVVGFNQFSTLLFSAIQDTNYGYYVNFQEGGANVIRLFVTLVPLIIAYFGREKLRELFPKGDIVVNLVILSGVMMIIATQNWIFARLGIYFTLYQLILMGWIVKLFNPKYQKFVYFSIVVLYLLYFYYENVIVLDIQYRSDYLVWPF